MGLGVRDVVAELLERREPGFPGDLVAERVAELVRGDAATVFAHDEVAPRVRRFGHSPGEGVLSDSQLCGLLDIHPDPRDHGLRPVRITDLVGSSATWRHSRAYAVLHELTGMRYELIVPLSTAFGPLHALGIMRNDRDFTERERDTITRLQPVLLGLHMLAEQPRRQTTGSTSPTPLTRRQQQVLHQMAKGLTVRAIAHHLGMSPHTAARHIEAIYARLDTHDRASTVMTAYRRGILT